MEPHRRLELEWAAFNKLDPAGMVSCSSGTAALHLAFEALELPLGSEVICPTFTMVACPRAIRAAGLEPVLVDCDSTLNMNPKLVDPAIFGRDEFELTNNNVKVVLAVHIYGRTCQLKGISYLRKRTNIKVIEDLAEAHGVRPHETTDAACWSFYRNKIIAGQEGGAVWFRDPKHAEKARTLRSLGLPAPKAGVPSPWQHVPRGWNHRMSDVHAQLVLDSLREYQANLKRRWELWDAYDEACPREWLLPRPDAPWVYALRVPGASFDRLARMVFELCARGIQARHAFRPVHLLKEFADCRRVGGGAAERAFEEVFYLPLSPELPDSAPRVAFQVLSGL